MADEGKLRVINIGIQTFYDALAAQKAKCTQIEWTPPVKQDEETQDLLDMFL